jgi:hypothetical protein
MGNEAGAPVDFFGFAGELSEGAGTDAATSRRCFSREQGTPSALNAGMPIP